MRRRLTSRESGLCARACAHLVWATLQTHWKIAARLWRLVFGVTTFFYKWALFGAKLSDGHMHVILKRRLRSYASSKFD
ncbi:unnamed protein product [Ixodes persulcatus]